MKKEIFIFIVQLIYRIALCSLIFYVGYGYGVRSGAVATIKRINTATDDYIKTFEWTESCWVKALEFLGATKNDSRTKEAKMIGGNIRGGYGHIWIEYTIRTPNGLFTAEYDPTCDKVIQSKNSVTLQNWIP